MTPFDRNRRQREAERMAQHDANELWAAMTRGLTNDQIDDLTADLMLETEEDDDS